MHRLAVSALALLALAAPALAVAPAEAPADEVSRVDYLCEGEPGFTAVFLNTAGGNSYAVMAQDDQPVWFEIAVSASGARYVSEPIDDGKGGAGVQLELWTKGDKATLSSLDGDNATPLRVDCTAAP